MIALTAEQAHQIVEALEANLTDDYLYYSQRVARKALATIREAIANAEKTPYQIGQQLARDGQGISAIWGAVASDSDMDECRRGMQSVWNEGNIND